MWNFLCWLVWFEFKQVVCKRSGVVEISQKNIIRVLPTQPKNDKLIPSFRENSKDVQKSLTPPYTSHISPHKSAYRYTVYNMVPPHDYHVNSSALNHSHANLSALNKFTPTHLQTNTFVPTHLHSINLIRPHLHLQSGTVVTWTHSSKLWLQLHAFSSLRVTWCLHFCAWRLLCNPGSCASMPLWGQRSVHKASLTASSSLCKVNPSICCAATTWTLWKDWTVILENVIMASPLREHVSKSMSRSWPDLCPDHWKVIVQQVMWFCWICVTSCGRRKAWTICRSHPQWHYGCDADVILFGKHHVQDPCSGIACWSSCSFQCEKRAQCSL